MRFAADTGATLIAEGVETATELMALSDLGISHAQGFFLARPMGIDRAARRARQAKGSPGGGEASSQPGTERTGRAASLQS